MTITLELHTTSGKPVFKDSNGDTAALHGHSLIGDVLTVAGVGDTLTEARALGLAAGKLLLVFDDTDASNNGLHVADGSNSSTHYRDDEPDQGPFHVVLSTSSNSGASYTVWNAATKGSFKSGTDDVEVLQASYSPGMDIEHEAEFSVLANGSDPDIRVVEDTVMIGNASHTSGLELYGDTSFPSSTSGTHHTVIAGDGGVAAGANKNNASHFAFKTAYDGSAYAIRFGSDGTGYFVTTTISSDRRLKDDIQTLSPEDSHAAIVSLNPVSYELKSSPGKRRLGLVAQEVTGLFPELVTAPENEEEFMSVNYAQFVSPLIAALQHQNQVIKGLEQRLSVLESQ